MVNSAFLMLFHVVLFDVERQGSLVNDAVSMH